MTDPDVQALAREIHRMKEQIAALSRSRQLSSSSIPITVNGDDGPEVIDVPLTAGVSQGVAAGVDSKFAKELALELGVNVGELSVEVSAAAGVAAAAQSTADAAQVEAETARAEATSKSAAAEAAAKAHADAEAEAARLAAVAEASGDATDKAAAAEAAAILAAAADAQTKADAAEAAAKADAAEAQATANAAASAAAAAQSTAGNAETIAQQAQDTASGKNKTFRETTAPSGVGTSDGDKWERYDTLGAGGKLLGTWSWYDGQWRSTMISETYLPLVNIGAGTYGTLSGGRLAATAIDGMTITGAMIRTAASGQRMQFDVSGLAAVNSAGSETARLYASSGGLSLSGTFTCADTFRNSIIQAGSIVTQVNDSAYSTMSASTSATAQTGVYKNSGVKQEAELWAAVAASRVRLRSDSGGSQESVFQVETAPNTPARMTFSSVLEIGANSLQTTKFRSKVEHFDDRPWARIDSTAYGTPIAVLGTGFVHEPNPYYDGLHARIKAGVLYITGRLTRTSFIGGSALLQVAPAFRPGRPVVQYAYTDGANFAVAQPDGTTIIALAGSSGATLGFSWPLA